MSERALRPQSRPGRIDPIRGLGGLAMALGFIALPFAVATTRQFQIVNTYHGYDLLWLGLLGPLIGQFAWFANPVGLFACCAMLRRWWLPRWMNVAMVILLGLFALDALAWVDVPTDAGPNPIVARHPGFHLWLLSVCVAEAGLIMVLLSPPRAQRVEAAGA